MKKWSIRHCVAVVLACLLFCLTTGTAAAAQKVVLRSVAFMPVNKYFHNYPLNRLKESVEARLPDKVEIKVIGSMGQVVSPLDALASVGKGVFDLVYTPPTYYTGLVPELTITDIQRPWTWRDSYRAPGFMKIMRQAVEEKTGAYLLGGFVGDGPMYILTKEKEIKKVDDLKGVKFRAPGAIGSRVAKRLGSAAVSMPLHEVYEAMQRGIVDGGFINAISLHDTNVHEFVKYITAPFLEFKVGCFLNKKVWDSLDPEIKGVMEEEWDRILHEHYGLIKSLDNRYIEEATKARAKYFDFPQPEMQKLRKAVTDDIEEWYLPNCPKYGKPLVEAYKPYL